MTLPRCLDPRCTDGPDDGSRLTRNTETLCRRCGGMVEMRLAELKSRHDQVARLMLTPLPSRSSGGNRPTKGSPPVELNLSAHDWIVEATATLVSWVRMVCEERNLRGPDRSDVGVLSGWLLSQLPWLLEHPAAGDLADELRDLSRVADSLSRVNPRRYRLDAPCPLLGCGERQMTREDGAGQVWCDACGGIWHEDEYAWMVRVALVSNAGCLTAAEAVDRLGVTVGTLRQWVSRGKVRKLGTVDGTARYSTADVEQLRKDGAA